MSQGGEALRDPGRVVVGGRREHHPVPEPDAARIAGAGAEEYLRGGRVSVFLQEVVLDLPHVVDAEAIGQLDLLDGIPKETVLGVLVPGTGELVFVEESEFSSFLTVLAAVGASYHSRRGVKLMPSRELGPTGRRPGVAGSAPAPTVRGLRRTRQERLLGRARLQPSRPTKGSLIAGGQTWAPNTIPSRLISIPSAGPARMPARP